MHGGLAFCFWAITRKEAIGMETRERKHKKSGRKGKR
jgi:hypothetical protein